MKRKIYFISFICVCLLLVACDVKDKEKNIKAESPEQEIWIKEQSEIENNNMEILDESTEQLSSVNSVPAESEEETKTSYPTEDYGEIQPYGGEFYYDETTQGFYYHLDCFYLNSDFLYTMNDTLEEFYDNYLEQYKEMENFYMEQGEADLPEGVVPYSELYFLGIQYVDNDYISLLFNDVTYMGGAHPYSEFDALTINRSNGEEVTVTEFLAESEEEILENVSELMGMDTVADWTDIDFYLQEDKIVFFYRKPGYWEKVTLDR